MGNSSSQRIARVFAPRVRLVLFFALTWLGVAILLAFLLNEGRREAERTAQSEALGISRMLEARLAATIRRVQGDLNHLVATLPRAAFKRGMVGQYGEAVVGELALYGGYFPELAGFRVMDATGAFLYASSPVLDTASVDDRSYLSALSESASHSLYFGQVEIERRSGRSLLPVSIAVRDAQGGLQGAIVALLDIAHLEQAFETTNVGPNGVIALRRTDDARLIFRRPLRPDLVNHAVTNNPLHMRLESGERQGTIRFRATIDGIERIYAFQRIEEFPLYVAAGLATADYLAEWRKTLAMAGMSALLLFLSLSLVLVRLLRAEKDERVTAAKLAESEARYRMLAENSHDVIWTLDIATRCYTYVSPSIVGMCGYQPEEVVGQVLDSRLTPESAARVARDVDQRLRRIAAGDKTANVLVNELEQICKNGQVISTEIVSTYLLNAEGVAHTILGITRNVSERKAAEAALHETNRQLHARIEEIGRLQVALQELAVRDSLTGLYNRRYLDETLEREVSRARREGIPLSLVMLDIDHFKRVNDTYGHQVGDQALKMLASILLANIRAEDVACRYGGEEFLILLPNMPLGAAIQRAEVWRSAVEELSVTMGDFNITFTISLGVAAYPEHGKTPDDLTRCADQALYRAKHEGRNQVAVFIG